MERIMRNWGMILVALLFLLVAVAISHAATLTWNAPPEPVDGYVVHYTDQTNDYTYNAGSQTTCDIDNLNFVIGVEYTLNVTAYNSIGASDPSNSVVWTQTAYTPPPDSIPPVILIPGPVTIIINP